MWFAGCLISLGPSWDVASVISRVRRNRRRGKAGVATSLTVVGSDRHQLFRSTLAAVQEDCCAEIVGAADAEFDAGCCVGFA